MDINWDQYKPILKRAYFNDVGLIFRETEMYDDFWKFFKKYLAVAAKKNAQSEKKPTVEHLTLNELGVPKEFSKYHKQVHTFNLDKTERYSLREIPTVVVNEFENILNCYLNFCQREKMNKLKKLRTSQRSLPIAQYRRHIVETVKNFGVTIIAGDTGCGKSTQVPQYLLSSGFDRVCCTQPRRIACISLAKRVAFETLDEYGNQIAYQIRFEKTRTASTKMLFLTEGLLLRQLSTDPDLSMYQVIILDEIHERHLHGDFLLGVLKCLIQRRTDLKLILMSATINVELFASYFADAACSLAPVINVPGRLYSIKLQYLPLTERESSKDRIDPGPYRRILQMIDEKYPANERGDMLVFLSGITEITTVAECLKEYAEQTKRWVILMLHSTLSLEEQDRVFDIAPENVRKCILSTNIAETSVTIDGVRFVVDSGKVKEMRYDNETKTHQLKEIAISQASAEQRKGRAGRTGPGVCYRLYSQQLYDGLDKYSTSEIRRVSLESLLLQMYNLGLPDPRKFHFIEPPDAESIELAIDQLKNQNALTRNELLTPLGRMLVNLPVDVSIGKMLIMGCMFCQVEIVLTLAAALSVQSPFTQRSYRELECQTLRQPLMSDNGDPFALLNVYREWLEEKSNQGADSTKRWCRKRGIEEQRLYEITKLRAQFKEILEDADLIERLEFNLSSVERRIRKGEIKRLKELKRTYQNQQRKRKVLKFEHYDAALGADSDDDDEDGTKRRKRQSADVNAVEFDISHTRSQVEERLKDHRMDFSTATILKFIVASALYPQLGILDQYNNYKVGADVMVHTKAKPFVVLHPNGCLAHDPEILCVTEDRDGGSANHQLIFYSLLLETTKPYVVNTLRVPALHTMLLLAPSIETSSDFSRIVCDNFIEFTFKKPGLAENLVLKASEIRLLFAKCLERKLDGDKYQSRELSTKIDDYLRMEIVYSMKRLIKADLISLYDKNADEQQQRRNSEKSKKQKSTELALDFLNVGRIKSQQSTNESGGATEYLATKWTCDVCGEDYYFTLPDKLEHVEMCKKSDKNVVSKSETDEEKSTLIQNLDDAGGPSSLKKHYFCEICDHQLYLTPTEILKHKRSHKK